MFGSVLALLLLQLPVPPAGATVTLRDWDGRPQVTVVVTATTPTPVDFTDGAGGRHHDVVITYQDPKRGEMRTTLGWFSAHVVPVFVPVGPPRPIHDLPLGGFPPPKPPTSNQELNDGIARPLDMLYTGPEPVGNRY